MYTGDLCTLGARQYQSWSRPGHPLYHLSYSQEIVLRRLAELVHVKVAALERVLLSSLGHVKAARALADHELLYISLVVCFS
jgi:hypothetical protein